MSKTEIKKTRPTISKFVVAEFSANPNIEAEELIKRVRKTFPWSVFQKTHVTWYKYQIRQGRYKLDGNKKLPPKKVKKVVKVA